MPLVHDWQAGYLASAQSANGPGALVLDTRACRNFGYLYYNVIGNSAVFGLEISHDRTAWMPYATFTALANTPATAQISAAYLPYVRTNMTAASGAGGTGTLNAFYAGGI